MEDSSLIPLFVVLVILAAGVAVMTFYTYRAVLEKWAEVNEYEILHSENRHFFRGPFFLNMDKRSYVYRLRVRDAEGQERSGWLMCRAVDRDFFSDVEDVRWDDEA